MYSVPSRWSHSCCTTRARKPESRRRARRPSRSLASTSIVVARSTCREAGRRARFRGGRGRENARAARALALSRSRSRNRAGRGSEAERAVRASARARARPRRRRSDLGVHAREREAALVVGLAPRAARHDGRVYEHGLLRTLGRVARRVDDDEPHVARDLRRGEPDAVRRVHDLEHARRERARLVVGAGARRPHRRVRRAQRGVRVLDEPQRRARDRAERVALGARRAAAEAERRARRAGPFERRETAAAPRRARARGREAARSRREEEGSRHRTRRAAHVIPEIAVVVSLAPTAGSSQSDFGGCRPSYLLSWRWST